MDLLRAKNAIKTVAEFDGVSEEKVIEDINHLIINTYKNIQSKKDFELIAIWEKISKKNDIPTAYEFIDFIARFVDKAIEKNMDLSSLNDWANKTD